MPKPWRLSQRASARLVEIAEWTLDTFGDRQASSYEAEIIARCNAVADGRSHVRKARAAIDPTLPDDLFLTRAGAHLIVFIDRPDEIIIIDFLHPRQDMPRRLAEMTRDL
ncbi:type II toxin-antitoxin system RelE/ParE family toxin [Acuticoccus sp. MNP-M23]|uniref:type II toxin-antitoxin system RelE/ParE family toxin n=1 Tax=Acuticoccus sp. MNP-M23 TaxID=3072793 RepID=UPI0035C21157